MQRHWMQLNHYSTKSKEEYYQKAFHYRKRGIRDARYVNDVDRFFRAFETKRGYKSDCRYENSSRVRQVLQEALRNITSISLVEAATFYTRIESMMK